VIERDIRKPKSSLKSLLQPFSPVLLSWIGKGDLVTLTTAEAAAPAIYLTGNALISGMYLNELLVRLLGQHVAYPELFTDYQQVLRQLQSNTQLDITLRSFEKKLLHALGYGLVLDVDTEQRPIRPEVYYKLDPFHGLLLTDEMDASSNRYYFVGSSLLALAQDRYDSTEQRRDAKRLMRLVLDAHLNGYRLKSRELWLDGKAH